MSWSTLDPAERTAIDAALTPKQLDVYKLRLAGCTHRQIAAMLGYKSKASVTDHLRAADNALGHLHRKDAA